VQTTFTISKASQADFQNTLKRYLQVNRRTLPEALNEKAYFIVAGSPTTQGAIRLTRKADYQRIKDELGAQMMSIGIGKRGKALKKQSLQIVTDYWAQLSVLIIIARLRKKGEKIPPAAELKEKALKMVRARIASVGFIRSGWLPALRRLARFSKYGRVKFASGDLPKKTGDFKGGVSPATAAQGNFAKCVIWNSAGGLTKHKGALIKYGQPGLEKAVQEETASMKKYLAGKLRENAHAAGVKTN